MKTLLLLATLFFTSYSQATTPQNSLPINSDLQGQLIAPVTATIAEGSDSLLGEYGYPYKDPYLATLTAAIAKPSDRFLKNHLKTVTFVYKSERSNTPILGKQNKIKYGYAIQKNKSAPLVFVLPGIGGTATSGLAFAMAEHFFQNGYHVITVPNPFSWQFSLAVSQDGLVGYAPRDAEDLYGFMKEVSRRVLNKTNAIVESYSLVGYSLGGVVAAHTLQVDNLQKYFNFSKVILVNPPIQLAHDIRVIDRQATVGSKWSTRRKMYLLDKFFTTGMYLLSRDVDDKYYLDLEKYMNASTEEMQWAIGTTFRQTLGEVMFTSQLITNLKILKTKVSEYQRDARMREIRKFGFEDYLRKFVVPHLVKKGIVHLDPNSPDPAMDIVEDVSLVSLSASIKNDPRLYMVHNQDDFLYTKEDDPWCTDTFGARAYIYPLGGHMGNFWFAQNRQDLLKILTGL